MSRGRPAGPGAGLERRRVRIDIFQYVDIIGVVSDLVCKLKALADPVRMGILELLPGKPECRDVYNVSELAGELGVSQSTVSHHLGILKSADLVRCQRMCRDVYYWVDREAVRACLRQAREKVL